MKSFLVILMGVLPLLSWAQMADRQAHGVGEELRSRVLIIPFHTGRCYFSDCDKAIAGESKLRTLEVRENFREAFDDVLGEVVGTRYAAIDLAGSKKANDVQFLKRYFRNIRYTYEAPSRMTSAPETTKWFSKVKDKISKIRIGQKGRGNDHRPKKTKEVEAYTWVSNDEDKYLAANWPENTFLTDLVKTYAPDYILTINQFEVKTDYRKCVDRELGNFTRRIRVHFNVFTSSGECIYGDVVTATYNSTTEDIENIIQDNFGLLSEFISSPLAMPMSSSQ